MAPCWAPQIIPSERLAGGLSGSPRPDGAADGPLCGLQSGSRREAGGVIALDIPARIGPVEFGELGAMVAVRCPQEHDPVIRRAGGEWEPGSRRWLVKRWRINPVIRTLRREVDPLSRRAGLPLDEG